MEVDTEDDGLASTTNDVTLDDGTKYEEINKENFQSKLKMLEEMNHQQQMLINDLKNFVERNHPEDKNIFRKSSTKRRTDEEKKIRREKMEVEKKLRDEQKEKEKRLREEQREKEKKLKEEKLKEERRLKEEKLKEEKRLKEEKLKEEKRLREEQKEKEKRLKEEQKEKDRKAREELKEKERREKGQTPTKGIDGMKEFMTGFLDRAKLENVPLISPFKLKSLASQMDPSKQIKTKKNSKEEAKRPPIHQILCVTNMEFEDIFKKINRLKNNDDIEMIDKMLYEDELRGRETMKMREVVKELKRNESLYRPDILNQKVQRQLISECRLKKGLGHQMKLIRCKYIQFRKNETIRPPYHGMKKTFRSRNVNAKRPLKRLPQINYELDSDVEWEKQKKLRKEEEMSGDDTDDEVDPKDQFEKDKFFVPHGHLSDTELEDQGIIVEKMRTIEDLETFNFVDDQVGSTKMNRRLRAPLVLRTFNEFAIPEGERPFATKRQTVYKVTEIINFIHAILHQMYLIYYDQKKRKDLRQYKKRSTVVAKMFQQFNNKYHKVLLNLKHILMTKADKLKFPAIVNFLTTSINLFQYPLTPDAYAQRTLCRLFLEEYSPNIYLRRSKKIPRPISLKQIENGIESDDDIILSDDDIKEHKRKEEKKFSEVLMKKKDRHHLDDLYDRAWSVNALENNKSYYENLKRFSLNDYHNRIVESYKKYGDINYLYLAHSIIPLRHGVIREKKRKKRGPNKKTLDTPKVKEKKSKNKSKSVDKSGNKTKTVEKPSNTQPPVKRQNTLESFLLKSTDKRKDSKEKKLKDNGKSVNSEKRKIVPEIQMEISEKTKEISEKEKDIPKKKEEIPEKKEEIPKKKKEIAEKKEEIPKKKEIPEKKEEIPKKKKEIPEKKQEISKKNNSKISKKKKKIWENEKKKKKNISIGNKGHSQTKRTEENDVTIEGVKFNEIKEIDLSVNDDLSEIVEINARRKTFGDSKKKPNSPIVVERKSIPIKSEKKIEKMSMDEQKKHDQPEPELIVLDESSEESSDDLDMYTEPVKKYRRPLRKSAKEFMDHLKSGTLSFDGVDEENVEEDAESFVVEEEEEEEEEETYSWDGEDSHPRETSSDDDIVF
ncbi:hypothetical protein SNEBB_009661 [Seison nebaliae]|nr:hypothetical protein SNEBB_009661 [Seison nebaliae]